jgi:hypothetical protein
MRSGTKRTHAKTNAVRNVKNKSIPTRRRRP